MAETNLSGLLLVLGASMHVPVSVLGYEQDGFRFQVSDPVF